MRVIFLDIDGVLNSEEYFDNHADELAVFNNENFDTFEIFSGKSQMYKLIDWAMMRIDPEKIALVKDIGNVTQAQVIMISSWSELFFYENILIELIKKGLPIGGSVDPTIEDKSEAINDFLNRRNVYSYVIIDSNDDLITDPELKRREVVTDDEVGITKTDVIEAMDVIYGKRRVLKDVQHS